jgi:hypothetical protein
MDAKELYSIMTPTFQRKYDAVVNATTYQEYLDAHAAFTSAFGHGCVTTVYLSAGSAFRLTMNSSDHAEAIGRKYGGSVALSGHYGGGHADASVAADWANDYKTSSKDVSLNVVVQDLPANSPTKDWASNMESSFTGATLSNLTEKAQKIESTSANPPVAPDRPKGHPKESDIREQAKIDTKDPAVSEAIQTDVMKRDGFSGTWKDYLTHQEKKLATLNPVSVVEEVDLT